MGACFDRLRCEVFQNLFLSPMNTGFVRPAVATVLTVYGIETITNAIHMLAFLCTLQQYLPFTVLKPNCNDAVFIKDCKLQQYLPFTVLKPNSRFNNIGRRNRNQVATVLTVYGIET